MAWQVANCGAHSRWYPRHEVLGGVEDIVYFSACVFMLKRPGTSDYKRTVDSHRASNPKESNNRETILLDSNVMTSTCSDLTWMRSLIKFVFPRSDHGKISKNYSITSKITLVIKVIRGNVLQLISLYQGYRDRLSECTRDGGVRIDLHFPFDEWCGFRLGDLIGCSPQNWHRTLSFVSDP